MYRRRLLRQRVDATYSGRQSAGIALVMDLLIRNPGQPDRQRQGDRPGLVVQRGWLGQLGRGTDALSQAVARRKLAAAAGIDHDDESVTPVFESAPRSADTAVSDTAGV
jgi:hypothetical protein